MDPSPQAVNRSEVETDLRDQDGCGTGSDYCEPDAPEAAIPGATALTLLIYNPAPCQPNNYAVMYRSFLRATGQARTPSNAGPLLLPVLIVAEPLVATSMRSFVQSAVSPSVMDASTNIPARPNLGHAGPHEARHGQAATKTATDTHLDLPALPTRTHTGHAAAARFEYRPVPSMQAPVPIGCELNPGVNPDCSAALQPGSVVQNATGSSSF